MLLQIDGFLFDINETTFESLSRSIKFDFATQARIGNFSSWQNIAKYEESITITGTLIAKSQSQLSEFEALAKLKQELTLAFSDGTLETIIILSLNMDRNSFLKDGKFLKQTYTISLAVIGDGLDYE